MKSMLSVIFSLILIINGFGQNYIGDHKLVVEGNAKLIIESDRATFNYQVKGYGSNLREAVSNAKSKASSATEILKSFGLTKSDISTSLFHSGENPYGSSFLSSSEDFVTNITTSVIVDSLEILEELILTLSDNDIEFISNIEFSLSNVEMFEEKVKKMAIEDAKVKGALIAEQFEVKIKKVIYIEENSIGRGYPNPFNVTTSIHIPEILGGSLYSKPIKITNSIKVVFAIG